ncbi:DUF4190 domain-containing protein [Akkermansiaceae bacterium]|nr:DUF4190 domain-containing protein [Akkermansiaceae bacterium]
MIQTNGQTILPMPQTRPGPSGLSIASLVLGIIGMVPCLSLFLSPLALIFGIISLVLAKQGQRPKGMAIAGTVLGAFGILFFGVLMVFAHLSTKPKPFVASAPEYETMIGEGLSGSGFHFESGGKRFIACSLHQFDGKAPATMLAPDLETDIPITGQVHEGTDIQVLSYDEKVFPDPSPLIHDGNPSVSVGDPVFLLIDDKAVKAHVTRYSFLEGHWFSAEKPFVGQGGSGSPVVSGLTGKVIGVFLGGEGGDMMTEGYFEDLEMP